MKIGPSLFELASQAKAKSRDAVERHYLQRVLNILKKRKERGLRDTDLKRIMGMYKAAKLDKEFKEFSEAAADYMSHQDRGVLSKVLDALGSIGRAFKAILMTGGRLDPGARQAAEELVRSAREAERQTRDVEQPAQAAARKSREPGQKDQEDQSTFSREYRTPNSSCVWSFQYNYAKSTLLVRFKAPIINHGSTDVIGGDRLPAQLVGRLGSSMESKMSDSPGVLYAYYDVPVRVFQRLITDWAIPHGRGGVGVWDELRIRGSLYGHKFRYAVAAAAEIPRGKDSAAYVPRMATNRGYRRRAVAERGTGRRGFVTSMLPERTEPDRGRPKRFERRGRFSPPPE